MSNPMGPESPAPAPEITDPPASAPVPARGPNAAVFVGLGLVVVGFALALIPFLGIIGWPLMLAGLILGIVGAAKKWSPMWGNIVNIALGFAGPGLAVALIVTGALAAAGPDAKSALEDAAKGGNTPPAQETPAEETPAEEPAAEPSGPSFADGVLTTEDMRIEITKHKVIPVGAKGNEYGDSPVIAFWYSVTNLSGSRMDPSSAFLFAFKAYQDNDPNAENELNVGMLPDSRFRDSQLSSIKKGGTVKNAVAYELTDEQTPVTLVAKDGLLGDEIGRIDYRLN